MQKKPNICVLMTTYNGEKYLKTQIESILNQRNVCVSIYVHDDGSTDKTMDILNDYIGNGVYIKHGRNHLGAANGFMELLYDSPEFDYYAFSDQDDIWKKDKLITAVKKINKRSIPTLYCSNQTIYINEKEIGLRFDKIPNYSTTELICGNHIAGCTMVMNKSLRDVLKDKYNRPSPDILSIRMHDVWVLLVADLCGKIIYDKNSYIDYRIHENNTVGIRKDSLKDKFNKFVKKVASPTRAHGRSRIALELLGRKFNIKDTKKEEVVYLFAHYKDSLRLKYKLFTSNQIQNECSENNFLFKLKTLFEWI